MGGNHEEVHARTVAAGLYCRFFGSNPRTSVRRFCRGCAGCDATLKTKAATLGAPNVNGEEAVAGKIVPALHFGATKMNSNFVLVDEVQKEMGGTATIFVKSGDEFIRVATNVKKDDGSRAIGTMLGPKGKASAAIAKGDSYFGEADILGKPYVTGYEPIRDASSNVIGIYYVGYLKN
jgi:hypothetical protein